MAIVAITNMLFFICIYMVKLACTLTFEAVYGTSCDTGINHPNQYFEESQKILKSKTPAAPV